MDVTGGLASGSNRRCEGSGPVGGLGIEKKAAEAWLGSGSVILLESRAGQSISFAESTDQIHWQRFFLPTRNMNAWLAPLKKAVIGGALPPRRWFPGRAQKQTMEKRLPWIVLEAILDDHRKVACILMVFRAHLLR